jgi:hypothetical protein
MECRTNMVGQQRFTAGTSQRHPWLNECFSHVLKNNFSVVAVAAAVAQLMQF